MHKVHFESNDAKFSENMEITNTSDEGAIRLPQKRYYRQRAHSNPLSDHDIIYPVSPEENLWNIHQSNKSASGTQIQALKSLYNTTRGEDITLKCEKKSFFEGMDWNSLFEGSSGGHPEFADIGCGYGGLLVKLSPMFSDINMVGMEIRVKVSDFVMDRIKALRANNSGIYNNICCLRTNAMKYLPNYFKKGQLSKMFFLYPDPHFKKNKHKWRIISQNLLTEYAYFLRPEGIIYTITDVEELHEWIDKHLKMHPLFCRLSAKEMEEDPVIPLLYERMQWVESSGLSKSCVELSPLKTMTIVPPSDEYESLSPTYSVWVHMAAGAAAGLAEHCVMFPMDSVKTRIQSLCHCPVVSHCPTPIHGVASMIKREGWLRPLRGVNAVAAGSVPAHAFYFTVYEKTKKYLIENNQNNRATSYAMAGVAATVFHDLIMNPAEVVKQRMQMTNSPYGGSLECVRCIYRNEGVSAFYRSYTTQLIMNIPFQTFHFLSYEFCNEILNPKHTYDPKTHLISGGLAGGIAAAVTTPLDCIKTVLNTQQSPSHSVEIIGGEKQQRRILYIAKGSYHGISDAISSIHATKGFQGFFSGLSARILYQMPATALSWSVYELFKFLLNDNRPA